MNAVNPLPSPASGAEPSMEEILASIRRIIADDQPLGAAPPDPADEAVAAGDTEEAAMRRPAVQPPVDPLPAEHGVVATPQFPTPDGTAGLMDTPHPLAPQAPEPPVAAEPEAETEVARGSAIALSDPDPHEAALRAMHEEPDLRAAAVQAAHDHVYEGQLGEEPEPVAPAHQAGPEDSPMPRASEAARERPAEAPTDGLFSAATSQSLAAAFNTLAISRLADDSTELRGLARDMLRPLLKDWLDENLPGLVESIIREEIDRMARRTR